MQRAIAVAGILPPGAEDGEVYRRVRSGHLISDNIAEGVDAWQESYAKQLAAAVHPQSPPLRAAE